MPTFTPPHPSEEPLITNSFAAHMIRSRSTINARAVCALEAIHRWCITGTPIQNRLNDLSSLLLFLRVSPYDDAKTFEDEITQPWKIDMDETAVFKLQTLMKIIALRRPKDVVSLPHRSETIVHVPFTAEEMEIYDRARLGIINSIDTALSSAESAGIGYINAFQRINDLRYICNHGRPPIRRKIRSKNSEFDSNSFQRELDRLLDVVGMVCSSCGTDIQEDADAGGIEIPPASMTSDTVEMCRHCMNQQARSIIPSPLGSDTDNSPTSSESTPIFSSKVRALVSQVQQVPTDDKWFDLTINSAISC
jgi:SWI/SNF-related matrix-associated actin-dependent regulator of chromatin subfamily A3